MTTIGQFSDQPEIEVEFVVDSDSGTLAKAMVRRGQTGVIVEMVRPNAGLVAGARIRCSIDRWVGDKPSTRVETIPLG